MSWHLAPALTTLRSQLDGAYPNRSRKSDGTLGDARHQREKSDHNPDGDGSVNAFDVTHGPYWKVRDVDCRVLADQLVASGDRRIKYVIFQRRIWQPGIGWSGYGGVSPHLEHLHLSVKHDRSLENDAAPWRIPMLGYGAQMPPPLAPVATQATPVPVTSPLPTIKDDLMHIFQQVFGQAKTAVITTGDGNLQPLTGEELALWQGFGVPTHQMNERAWDLMLTKFVNGQQFHR